MSEDTIAEQGRALDDAFYEGDRDALRAALAAEEAAAAGALGRATGIDDEELLARLAELGIRPETLAALTLIPLIETAWADGVMDPKERDAVLQGAVSSGIGEQSASYHLLELWTLERPAKELVGLWHEFVGAVADSLTANERRRMRGKVIGRAHMVAAAAGGLLDAQPNVSAEEKAVMDELAASFRVPD